MSFDPQALSRRDRAFVELARARGWVSDQALDEISSEVAGDLAEALQAAGLLTVEQTVSLWEAVDGVPGGSMPRVPAPGVREGEGFGTYRLVKELGRGGMGAVYRAVHGETGREVALKVMLQPAAESAPEAERFRRESELVARLGGHPHLVAIHEVGVVADRLYFTMDYVEGRSVKQRIAEEGPLPGREAARICAEIAGALDFVHRAGVVHRDVKPHNMLLDAAGKAYLTDFGLAKDIVGPGGLTVSGTALGTPAYMSPEVAAHGGRRAQPASDVYSLGASLYEMLTGRFPFAGATGMELVKLVVEAEPPPPRAMRTGIHPDLEVICLRAMHRDPARRYGSAGGMEADLRRWLGGESIHARPVGSLERMATRARRHRAAVAAAAASALALLAIAAWSGREWWTREQARRAADEDRADRIRRVTPLAQEGALLIRQADAAEANGRPAERNALAERAVAALRAAVEVQPANADLWFDLGRACRRARQAPEALAALEEAVRLNPGHSLAWFEHGLIAQDEFLRLRGTVFRNVWLTRPNVVGYRVTKEPTFHVVRAGGTGDTDTQWRQVAARDFGRVLATGAVAERAAYGKAMGLYFEEKHEEALAELDRAFALNPYFVPVLRAQAEIREWRSSDARQGLPWRRRYYELQPRNPEAALDYALSLAVLGERAEAARVVTEIMEGREELELLVRAGWILLSANQVAAAGDFTRRATAAARSDPEKLYAVNFTWLFLLQVRRHDEALALVDAHAALLGPENAAAMRGETFSEGGRHADAAREYRRLPPRSALWSAHASDIAWAEWMCGNTARALEAADAAVAHSAAGNAHTHRGIARLESGLYAGALEDFEAARKADPSNPNSYSNTAATLFMLDRYAEAMEFLELGFLRSPVPEGVKEQVKKSFVGLKKRAREAGSALEAGDCAESIVAMLQLAIMQAGVDADSTAAAREGLRVMLWALQEFYFRKDLLKRSAGAGERHLRIRRCGNVLYKQARALAAQGKKEEALAELEAALEEGFEDRGRLDGEKVFDALRQEPRFAAVREKCR
ncbi:MAG: protein kinase [Planctomycetes bacterium]|nr:protein kinase [Planctomycetota bacterium]